MTPPAVPAREHAAIEAIESLLQGEGVPVSPLRWAGKAIPVLEEAANALAALAARNQQLEQALQQIADPAGRHSKRATEIARAALAAGGER